MDLSVEKLYFTTKATKHTKEKELHLLEYSSQKHNRHNHNHLRKTSDQENLSFFFVVRELFRLVLIREIRVVRAIRVQ